MCRLPSPQRNSDHEPLPHFAHPWSVWENADESLRECLSFTWEYHVSILQAVGKKTYHSNDIVTWERLSFMWLVGKWCRGSPWRVEIKVVRVQAEKRGRARGQNVNKPLVAMQRESLCSSLAFIGISRRKRHRSRKLLLAWVGCRGSPLRLGQDGIHESATVQEETPRGTARGRGARDNLWSSAVGSRIGQKEIILWRRRPWVGWGRCRERNRDSRGSWARKQQSPKRWRVHNRIGNNKQQQISPSLVYKELVKNF